MKKVLLFVGLIIIIFASIAFLSSKDSEKKTEKIAGNPYGKATLRDSTIDLLDNEHYQNIITPTKLDTILKNDEEATVYFFSSECEHCIKVTPIVDPVAKEMNLNWYQYNVLEFEQGWDDYLIEGTPTIIHFENGKEKDRIVGEHSEAEFKDWFTEQTR